MRVVKEMQVIEVQQRLKDSGITLSRAVIDAVIVAYLEMIRSNLVNGFSVLTNLGTFSTYVSKATFRKSPKDQSDINIPAQIRPKLKFSTSLTAELKELSTEQDVA